MARVIGNNNDENLIGTAFADFIAGNGGIDWVFGLEGRDRIFGGDADDRLFGQEGNDRVFGGNGNDRLRGGDGADRLQGDLGRDGLFGGAGADQFVFISGDTASDRVRDYEDEVDRLNVQAWDVTFADLTFRETANGNLVVRGNDAGERFVIIGATEAQIDAGDFIF